MKMNGLDMATMALVVIGALNWGLVGLAGVNVVDMIFGVESMLSKVVYILVGVSGLYTVYKWYGMGGKKK